MSTGAGFSFGYVRGFFDLSVCVIRSSSLSSVRPGGILECVQIPFFRHSLSLFSLSLRSFPIELTARAPEAAAFSKVRLWHSFNPPQRRRLRRRRRRHFNQHSCSSAEAIRSSVSSSLLLLLSASISEACFGAAASAASDETSVSWKGRKGLV